MRFGVRNSGARTVVMGQYLALTGSEKAAALAIEQRWPFIKAHRQRVKRKKAEGGLISVNLLSTNTGIPVAEAFSFVRLTTMTNLLTGFRQTQ